MITNILSIVFCLAGIISSYYFTKWQMKRNKIVHLYLNSYDIGKGLTSEFPEFSLIYYDEPLSKNVIVLKGKFINNGRNDLDSFNGDSDIKITLPDGCRILKITTSPSTEQLKVEGKRDTNNINVANFGISEYMMPNESFEYTVIFETANNIRNIQDELKFYQRIKGTDRKIKSIDHYMNSLKKIRYIYYFGYILSFFMTLPIVYLLLDFFPNLNRKVLVLSSIVFCFLLWLSCIHFSSYMSRHVMKYRKENKKQQEMEG